jgi:hypothetical protein
MAVCLLSAVQHALAMRTADIFPEQIQFVIHNEDPGEMDPDLTWMRAFEPP